MGYLGEQLGEDEVGMPCREMVAPPLWWPVLQ